MHPDLKVGLALTLLIVGFAAAMCFRHRPTEDAPRATLAADPDLDAEMELLPVRTYGAEADDGAEEDLSGASDGLPIDASPVTASELEIPQPIGTSGDPDATADGVPAVPEEDAASTYTVKSGDTLSGIAAALLGSTQRYAEIFEANRHLLNSPNDLKPGMELTIPPRERQPVVGEADLGVPLLDEPTPAAQTPVSPAVPR